MLQENKSQILFAEKTIKLWHKHWLLEKNIAYSRRAFYFCKGLSLLTPSAILQRTTKSLLITPHPKHNSSTPLQIFHLESSKIFLQGNPAHNNTSTQVSTTTVEYLIKKKFKKWLLHGVSCMFIKLNPNVI